MSEDKTGQPDVELVAVTKAFGSFVAVKDVSFQVPRGSFFSLLGPSGCGKSTTLRMIAGLEQPDSGRLLIAGTDMSGVPAFRRPTNMVFQRWALFPHMTAAENVAFGLEADRRPREEIRTRVADALALVGLGDLAARKPGQLSGGQMQRVALARALVKRPQVLLLDEPLGALDLKLRLQMQLELKRIQREVGTTFIYVTHDQAEAMTMSDGIAVMNEGRLEQIGGPQEIYDRPATRFVAGFIGNANILPATFAPDGPDAVRVDLGGFAFRARADMPAAARGHAVLRYERLRLDPPAGMVAARATVRDAIFTGSAIHYVLGVDGTPVELIAEAPYDGSGVMHQRGAPVTVGWDEAAPRLFTDG
jgi:spermidine/putrescine transport system ATP-binding protein